MRKKIIASLIVILLVFSPLSAAGMLTFDIENWVYSILSYTGQETDILNTINNIKREIELAKKVYAAATEGDILGAIQALNKTLNKIEKDYDKYIDMSGILGDLSGLRNDLVSLASGGRIPSPSRLGSTMNQLKRISARVAEAKDEHQQDKEENMDETKTSSEEKAEDVETDSKSESPTQIAVKANQLETEAQINDSAAAVEEEVDKIYVLTDEQLMQLIDFAVNASIVATNSESDETYKANIEDLWSNTFSASDAVAYAQN